MACDKIIDTCFNKTTTECIKYTGTPKYPVLYTDTDCVTMTTVIDDLYVKLDNSKYITGINNTCLGLVNTGDKHLITDVVKKLTSEVCNIKDGGTEYSDLDISNLNLDFKCLTPECAGGFQKLSGLLQAIINKICTN